MKSLRACGYALSAGLAATLLWGCGLSQSLGMPMTPAGTANRGTSGSYAVYSFRHRSEGAEPSAGLVEVSGTLYGTAAAGGLSRKGTIFRVGPSGQLTAIYRFRSGADGANPHGALINVNGTLYGTTEYGGASHAGTVFSVTTAGAEKVLYSFKGGYDGAYPVAGLLEVNGTLYGTTRQGGTGCSSENGCGTVYSMDTAGDETVLHRFTGGSDGAFPTAPLIDVKGTLYGTTGLGGSCQTYGGCGTVFSIGTSGAEKVLYGFQGGSDGEEPNGLLDVNGVLYGTTNAGGQDGSECSHAFYCGTVFRVTTKGVERILYRFADGLDGAEPQSPLIELNGMLYGTRTEGGEGGHCSFPNGNCGTVFSITTSGTETVLHRFAAGQDGWFPAAPLLDVNGTLYGTTLAGGGHKCGNGNGCGTVFSLTP